MPKKLIDVYTPVAARFHLQGTFKDCPMMITKINLMGNKQLQTLACLVDGYTLSEVGRGLKVDIEDTCFQGRVGELITIYCLPVQRSKVDFVSEGGSESKRTMYSMRAEDVERLKDQKKAAELCKLVKARASISSVRSESNDMKRQIKKRGASTAAVMLLSTSARSKPSRATKQRMKKDIDALIARYRLDGGNGDRP